MLRSVHRRSAQLGAAAAALAAASALGGCISAAEMQARHRQACLTYGFTAGTEGYANCLLQLDVGDYGYGHHGRRPPMPHPPPAATPSGGLPPT